VSKTFILLPHQDLHHYDWENITGQRQTEVVKMKTFLTDVLRADYSHFLQHMQNELFVNMRTYMHPLSQYAPSQSETTVISLLDKMINKGEVFCHTFLAPLQEPDITDIVPRLRELWGNTKLSTTTTDSSPGPSTGQAQSTSLL
jgi:predicted transcriptional regulator